MRYLGDDDGDVGAVWVCLRPSRLVMKDLSYEKP